MKLVIWTFIALLGAMLPANAQDYLLFCNNPEKIRMPGVVADAKLIGGRTYTIFFHYRNGTSGRAPLVVAFQGSKNKPLNIAVRKGIGDARTDPSVAGRQAMARFLSGAQRHYRGKGGARFAIGLKPLQVASGIMTVRADQDTRLRIYYRHGRWTVPGARAVAVAAPRREVQIALTADSKRQTFRIGQPVAGMSKHMDGAYGLVYTFRVAAPPGRRVRVSFSPRGGKSGMVGSINGLLRQSGIVPAASWKVFCEAVAGRNGVNMTTSPFGGVFYPVELVFQLL